MRVLMYALGSAGDAYPQIGIGTRLAALGHEVTIFAQERYCGFARRCGLDAVPTNTEADARRLEDTDLFWDPSAASLRMFCDLLGQRMERDVDMLLDRFEAGRTLFVGSTAAYATRIAAEARGAPFAFVHLAPSNMRSFARPSEVAGVRSPARMRPPVRRLVFWAADRYTDRHLAPAYNAQRARFGLSSRSRILVGENISPHLTLALFPEWFAKRAPDWHTSVRCVGFPLFDTSTLDELDPELESWLDEGEPPLLFTIGSFNRQGAAFFRVGVQAAERIGRRALVVTRAASTVPSDLAPRHRHESYVPFGRLLPRCALVAHHGGVGTLAGALMQGVPQLIHPIAFDQPDNALRLETLGVARSIRPRRFRVETVAGALDELLASREIAVRTRHCAELMKENDGTGRAAELLAGLDPSREALAPVDHLAQP